MGKSKRQKLRKPLKRKVTSKASTNNGGHPATNTTKSHRQTHRHDPTIPFSPIDDILLVGEGDLSFARSLLEHHICERITATVYEASREELKGKYPDVEGNLEAVEDGGGRVRFGLDVTKAGSWREYSRKEKGGSEGEGTMDRIMFNFPHVGGKSKDVNRQVRYNQELLVSFFTHATPCLSPRVGSSIIVTLFEGSPYTLWNIRDLARHSGLEVKESFKFQARAYPGYKHARTLGVVKAKDGEIDGERRGWKGEERDARTYVFVRKGEGQVMGGSAAKRKRKDGESEDESESDGGGDGNDSDRQDTEESDNELWNGIEAGTEESDADEND